MIQAQQSAYVGHNCFLNRILMDGQRLMTLRQYVLLENYFGQMFMQMGPGQQCISNLPLNRLLISGPYGKASYVNMLCLEWQNKMSITTFGTCCFNTRQETTSPKVDGFWKCLANLTYIKIQKKTMYCFGELLYIDIMLYAVVQTGFAQSL